MEQFILRVCEAENKLHDVEISFTLSSLESFTGIFIFCLHPENRKKVSTKQYDLLCASFIYLLLSCARDRIYDKNIYFEHIF